MRSTPSFVRLLTAALLLPLMASPAPGSILSVADGPSESAPPIAAEGAPSPLAPTSVRLSPLAIALDGARPQPDGSSDGPAALIDRDTTTALTPTAARRMVVTFESSSPILAVKVYGSASYVLRLSAPSAAKAGAWRAIPGFEALDLRELPEAWSRLPLQQPVMTDRVLVELTPAASAAPQGLAEIEFWSDSGMARDTADPVDLMAKVATGLPPFETRFFPFDSVTAASGGEAVFTADIPWDVRGIRRAYLTYDLNGVSDWTAVTRTVNDRGSLGGAPASPTRAWGAQIEEINPEWLRRGENRIVLRVPEGLDAAASLRRVGVLAEMDDGRNFVEAAGVGTIESPMPLLHDAETSASWSPYAAGAGADPSLVMRFESAIELDAVAVNLSGTLGGTVDVSTLGDASWSAAAAMRGTDLRPGWNVVPLPQGSATAGVRLAFTPVAGGDGAITEVRPIGSGVGRGRLPASLRIVHPATDHFAGRETYVRGFVTPIDDGTGKAAIRVAGRGVASDDGSFGVAVDKDDVGLWDQADDAPWSVTVTATYPGGTVITRDIPLLHADAPPVSTPDGLLTRRGFDVRPDRAKRIRHDEAELDLEAGSVDREKELTVTPLSDADLPALDMGMTNVTKGPRKGYRFEPHGTKFLRPARLSLPYDPALLPDGMTEADVHTYFFDEQTGRWAALERLSVDGAAATVASVTDHFTDMINATLSVPEHAQPVSHDKNAMQEVKPGEPGARVTLVQPPAATSMGATRLSYPIDLPKGRLGLQPELEVRYESGEGNGWVGAGWDLPVSAVTVETRWGVPRYDGAKETESYVMDGQELTPIVHRGALVARTGEKVFHARLEGAFSRIVRHGAAPSAYWWEVTNRNGVTSFYGGDPATGAVDAGAVLADDSGRVFRWLLREVRDLHGNGMRYTYDRVNDAGVAGGTVMGRQQYLRTIDYTRTGSASGAYTVTFRRDAELGEPRRPDVPIDARGGFKMVTSQLLRRIEVALNGSPIRSYDLGYVRGAFGKTLLGSIAQRGADGSLFHTHRFSYYNDVETNGVYTGFGPTESWSTGNDNVRAAVVDDLASTFGSDDGKATALSGYETEQAGGHLYAGFNPDAPTKSGSVGGKIGFTGTLSSGALLALLDLNGDGLPDKVFKTRSGISIRMNRSGPHGGTTFGPPRSVSTLPSLAQESAITVSFGAEAYPGVSLLTNNATGFTTASTYFSDVNGDGLPDLVQGGAVLYNHLDASGTPTFDPDSATSPVPVDGGSVDGAGLFPDLGPLQQQALDNASLCDTVRRWTAPWTGQISITGDVALQAAAPPAGTADGVRVAIQHNGVEKWSATIAQNDTSAHAPSGVDTIDVTRGDRIYFRMQSRTDGSRDVVSWDPRIVYNAAPVSTDANLLDVYRTRASEDFTLAGRSGIRVQAPYTGRLKLEGDLNKAGVTTDDIVVQLLKNDVPISTAIKARDAVGTASIATSFDVVEGDYIRLRVQVDSNIDLHQLSWTPRLYYLGPEDGAPSPTHAVDGSTLTIPRVRDAQGNPLTDLHPPYDIDFYPVDGLTAPQGTFTAPADGTYHVASHLVATPGASGIVKMTVKKRGELLAKRTIFVTNGGVVNNGVDVDLAEDDQVFLDYWCYDAELASHIGNRVITVDGSNKPSAFHTTSAQGVFPQPYRGWAVAGYNGNPPRDAAPLDESQLDVTFDSGSSYDPRTSKAHLYSPFPEQNRWRGPEDQTFAAPGGAGSSRLGPDFLPLPGAGSGGRAPARLSVSQQKAVQAGVSLLSGSTSSGGGNSDVDFLDLNGDKFPDVVGVGRVQYTTLTGGLEPANRPVTNHDKPRVVKSAAANVSVGGSPATFRLASSAMVDTPGPGASPKENDTGSQMVSLGLGGGLGSGSSTVDYDLVDVNGDGLPDRARVSGSNLTVALNLGYAFAAYEPWGTGSLNAGTSSNQSIGVNLGFNGGIYDYGGGLSLDKNASETTATFLDINGDGLPDRVRRSGSAIRVGVNTGNGFLADRDWGGAPSGAFATTGSTSAGAGGYFTVGIGPLCLFGCYVILNPGADGGTSMARQETALIDVDGDGKIDHLSSRNDASLTVARNTTGRTNLLRRVERPMGATIDIEYERDGNTTDMPQSRWVLSKVRLFDGLAGDGVDTQIATYHYADGVWDRLEREFYGYGKVTEEVRDASQGEALVRSLVHEYRTDSYYTKGLVAREVTLDGAGRPFRETDYDYLTTDVMTGAPALDLKTTTGTLFVAHHRTDQKWFEGQAAPGKETYTIEDYDGVGNIVRRFEAGDPGPEDDVEATVEYASCPATNLLAAPVRITVKGNGVEMRRREGVVDCATGNLTSLTAFLEGGAGAVTSMEYDAAGNRTRVVDPPNALGQRYEMRYEYDPTVRTYITRSTDSFGYQSSASHDLKQGLPLTVTDMNGNTVSYVYDAYGRAVSVTGPYEQGTGAPTVTFEYHPEAVVPWSLTRHLDKYRNPADPIDVAVLVDGLGRRVQVKHDAAVTPSPGATPADVMVVSGRVRFDALGRITDRWYPVTEPLGTAGVFNASYDTVTPRREEFDVLDRTTRIVLPDGTTETTARDFGPDRDGMAQFRALHTDANGARQRTFTNVRELVTSVEQDHQPPAGPLQALWTSFGYDPMRQLVRLTDDHGNHTRIGWDNFGRKTFLDSPDQGKTESVYDLASHTITKITANLRAEGRRIAYDYQFNRLVRILYPDFPGNNVTFTYGPPGAPGNAAGRITALTDQAGSETRAYGKLGEVLSEVRSVASDTGPTPEIYRTDYVYDTFGRLQSLVYPDGETLTYAYDSGGMARRVTGRKGSFDYEYVRRLEYDKFGQRSFMEAGNGARTTLAYRADNRRLLNVNVAAGSGAFLNVGYAYDPVGNILSRTNNVPIPSSSSYGGPIQQDFTYDDLDRVVASQGAWQYAPGKNNRYTAAFDYDTIHNIVSRDQHHEVVQGSGTPVTQHKTTYDNDYVYAGPRPHAATHIGERTFTYDANGNQARWDDDTNGTRRTIVWDEENRIQSLFENGHEMTYKYDETGERVVKRGPQGETVYVNPWFTIRNRTGGTKHVWVGPTRFVSKLVKQNAREKDLYFLHADPVMSTSFVTDAGGRLYEHFEYFPFGETWVEESSNTQRTPYQFTGKELDEETGLYYMGARYYDPRIGSFNATEPLLFSHPEKGRDNPNFLSAYSYAYENPVRYLDPDGKDVVIAIGYDKDKPERARFIKSAETLKKSLDAQNIKYTVVMIPATGSAKKAIADGAAGLAKGGGKVSNFVWIGHGEINEGAFLPRAGDSLSIDDAISASGLQSGGAVVAIGCQVQKGAHVNQLRDKGIHFFGTALNAWWRNDGKVTVNEAHDVKHPPPDEDFVPTDQLRLPDVTEVIKYDPNCDAFCATNKKDPTIGSSISEAEARVNKGTP